MIPKDAPKPDWNMYYHDTYMTHKIMGPCRIQVHNKDNGGKQLYASRVIAGRNSLDAGVKVRATDLQILWPRPGAYNFFTLFGAGFIGRTPQRHMKRSAFRDHYYVLWSPISLPAEYMMSNIVCNAEYRTLKQFYSGLTNKKVVTSAALSNKLILYQPQGYTRASVVYLGEEIGFLKDDKFTPHMPNDSRLRRIMRHFVPLGIS